MAQSMIYMYVSVSLSLMDFPIVCTTLTITQVATIRLGVEVYLHHLNPASWNKDPVQVAKIRGPSFGIDSAGKQSAVHKVEGVVVVCQTAHS